MINETSGLVNATQLYKELAQEYTDVSYGLTILALLIGIFALMLLWMYYQEKYLHALRTIERICTDVPIDAEKLAVYVHDAKQRPIKKWREYFE